MPMIIFLCVLMGIFSSLEASYLFRNGKLTKTEEVATLSVQEHYGEAMEAFQSGQWDELVRHMIIVIKNFPTSPFAQEAYYYLAVGYFHLQEYDFSNRFFTQYLKKEATPKF